MIQIDDKIISLELFSSKFACDYAKCKGICCVEGDSGAPVEQDEAAIIEQEYPKISHLLSEKAKLEIEKNGSSVIDFEDDLVTPIINGRECVYTHIEENGNVMCAFEMGWKEGITSFRKPISCHLYPLRISKLSSGEALNYDKWPICGDAVCKGRKLNIPAFRFIKEPIITKYGEEFYNEMEEAYSHLIESGIIRQKS